MTDRELLEAAAKAAGLPDAKWDDYLGLVYTAENGIKECPWRPLESDGDALRLAVKLMIDVQQTMVHSFAWCNPLMDMNKANYFEIRELRNDDPYAATRRAIVRAAAEIGKETK